jgi:hypothetical protein
LTGGVNIDLSGHAYLPLANDAVTPTINFGDDGDGIYSSADGYVDIATNGAHRAYFSDTAFSADAAMFLLERAAAEADVAGYGQLWIKSDTPNTLWFTNDAGTDVQLGVAETDPIVGAITGLVKADGAGAISAAVADTDYQSALSGATITSATVATDDKVLIQDTNDTDNLKTVTAQSIADLAAAGVEVNVETLSVGDKTIADGDPTYQLLNPGGANRDVYLPAAPSGDCEFVIVNAVSYSSAFYLEIQLSGDTNYFTRLYASNSARFVFDSSDGLWRCVGPGFQRTRTAANTYDSGSLNVAVGYSANANTSGAAVGSSANANTSGAAVGYNTNGSSYGAAVGHSANGSSYGAAVGLNANGSVSGAVVGCGANGSTNGAAIGHSADGASTGVALGFRADTNENLYSTALGPYSQGARYGDVASLGTTATETMTFRKSEVSWYGAVAGDAGSTEIMLRGVASKYCTVFASSTVSIKGTIIARDVTADESDVWEFTYSVTNDAGTTTELHAPIITVIHQDDATWDFDLDVVDSTTDYIRLKVTPDADNSTEFFAYAVITEIIE